MFTYFYTKVHLIVKEMILNPAVTFNMHFWDRFFLYSVAGLAVPAIMGKSVGSVSLDLKKSNPKRYHINDSKTDETR